MRKRTYLDKKFSQGDANSEQYRDNWAATFEEKCSFCGHAESNHDEMECLVGNCRCGFGER